MRVPRERGGRTRVELRAGDGAANSHLIVAAALAAGIDGIQRRLTLPAAATSERAGDGVGKPLPRSLEAALDLLERDELLRAALGAELVETFVRLKRFEAARFAKWVTDWELAEYAHHL